MWEVSITRGGNIGDYKRLYILTESSALNPINTSTSAAVPYAAARCKQVQPPTDCTSILGKPLKTVIPKSSRPLSPRDPPWKSEERDLPDGWKMWNIGVTPILLMWLKSAPAGGEIEKCQCAVGRMWMRANPLHFK